MKNVFLFCALILVASFVLHGIMPHEHAEELFGTGMEAAMHGQDKKLFLLALALLFLTVLDRIVACARTLLALSLCGLSRRILFDPHRAVDSLRVALSQGIIHPKLCD